VVVGATKENPATGRKADVLQAAYLAGEASMRLIKPEHKTGDVPTTVEKILEAFQCKFVEGFTSHQMLKNLLDAEKTIFFRTSEGQKKEYKQFDFAEGEVYGIDILVSTGEGKPKPAETKTTVFRKTKETYLLKMKTSRAVYSEVTSNHGTFGFNIRSLEDEKRARMGMLECITHNLVTPYDVLYEKEGELVALFKYTIMISAGGAIVVAAPEFNQDLVKSERTLQDENLKKLVVASLKKKTPKKTTPKAGESSKEGGDKAAPEAGKQ